MKNLLKRLTAVTSLAIALLLIPSCQSSKQIIEYKVVTVYPDLHFPKFPKTQTIIHVDENFKQVTDEETDVYYDIVPHWYMTLLADFYINYQATEAQYYAFINTKK